MKTIKPLNLKIIRSDLDHIAKAKGIIVVLVTPQGARSEEHTSELQSHS